MVEGAIAALIMERDMSAWAIGFDSRLLAAVYSVSTTLCESQVQLCDSFNSSEPNVNSYNTRDYSLFTAHGAMLQELFLSHISMESSERST